MDCITANIVGAFALTIIFFDIVKENWTDLPYHSVYGLVITGFFWILCSMLGKEISMAILLVPALILLVSLISIWLYGISMKNKGCCLQCNGPPESNPQPEPCTPEPNPEPTCLFSGELNAKPLF